MRCSSIIFAVLFVFSAVFVDRTRLGITVIDLATQLSKLLPQSTDEFVLALSNALSDSVNVTAYDGAYKINAKLRSGYEAWGIVYNNYTNKQDNQLLPVVYFIPVGGYSVIAPVTYSQPFANIAHDSGFVLISLTCRPPPRKFLGLLEDAYDGLLWVRDNVKKFGGDPKKIFVAGGSAGGHLAIASAMKARDTNDVSLAGIIAISPKVRNGPDWNQSPSFAKYGGEFPNGYGLSLSFTTKVMSSFKDIEKLAKSPLDLQYANPVSANLSNLPPVFLQCSEKDPLHDENVLFAQKWREHNDKCICKSGNSVGSFKSNIEFMDIDGDIHGGSYLFPNVFPSQNAKLFGGIKNFIKDIINNK